MIDSPQGIGAAFPALVNHAPAGHGPAGFDPGRTIASANCRSLARIVAALVNENEPLLKAEHDGATVTVRERGGPAAMRFTVERLNEESKHDGAGE